jgi:hypothetical protein
MVHLGSGERLKWSVRLSKIKRRVGIGEEARKIQTLRLIGYINVEK